MLVVFQPSLVQAPLTQAISLITGRQFQIEGAFHLEPSFQPHLTASRVTLANAPWAKVPQLIEIEHIQVSVDLIALFRGSIRLPTLQIAGATINLEQNAAGRKNWRIFTTAPGREDAAGFPMPEIKTLSLSDIHLSLDRADESSFVADLTTAFASIDPRTGIQAQIAAVLNGERVTLNIDSNMETVTQSGGAAFPLSATLNAANIQLAAEGTVGWPLRNTDTNLRVKLRGGDLSRLGSVLGMNWPVPGVVRLDAVFTGNQKAQHFRQISASLGEIRLAGDLLMKTVGTRPHIKADLRINRLPESLWSTPVSRRNMSSARSSAEKPTTSLRRLAAVDGEIKLSVEELTLRGNRITDLYWNSTLSKGRLDVSLRAQPAFTDRVEATLHLDSLATQPSYRLQVAAGQIRLGDLLQFSFAKQPASGTIDRMQLDLSGRLARKSALSAVDNLDWELEKANLVLASDKVEPVPLTIDQLHARLEPKTRTLSLDANGVFEGRPLNLRLEAGTLVQLLDKTKPQPIKLKLSTETTQIVADGSYHYESGKPRYQAQIQINAESLDRLGELAVARFPDTGPIAATLQLTGNEQKLQIIEATMSIGQSRIQGDGNILLTGDKNRITAHLRANPLQVIDFIGSGQTTLREQPPVKSDRLLPDLAINTAFLNALNAEIKLNIEQLLHGSNNLGTYLVSAEAKDNLLSLDAEVKSSYLAGADIHAEVGSQTGVPTIKLDAAFTGLDYGDLLQALNITSDVKGRVDIKLALQGHGKRLPELVANGNGHAWISGGKGEMPYQLLSFWGGDLAKILLPSNLNGQTRTYLNCLAARFKLESGSLRSEGIVFDTRNTILTGFLDIALPSEKLMAQLQPKPRKASLVTIDTPVRITGTLANPRYDAVTADNLLTLGKLAVGVSNPATLVLLFGSLGSDEKNLCEAVINGEYSGSQQGLREKIESTVTAPVKGLIDILGGAKGSKQGGGK